MVEDDRHQIREALTEKIYNFLSRYYWDELNEFLLHYPDSRSFYVDYTALLNFRFDNEKTLADMFEEDPDEFLSIFEHVVKDEITTPLDIDKDINEVVMRVRGFPYQTQIRNIRDIHINNIVCIEGIVNKVSEIKSKITNAAFYCMRCEHVTYIPQFGEKFTEPHECENETCGRKGPFKKLYEKSSFQNYKVIEIQESPDSIDSAKPQSMYCELYEDLAMSQVQAGDKVLATGVARARQAEKNGQKSTLFDIFLETNNIEKVEEDYDEVEITQDDEEDIIEFSKDPELKEKIKDSIATSVIGYDEVKNCYSLQLFGCDPLKLPDGSITRGDIHSLSVGDPGISKSEMLRMMTSKSPRGVYSSGKSSSAAGLTAAAVKDDMIKDKWTIQGGALVLADKGVACIDEIDKMSDEDRSSMHEAMEQQRVTVTKAGMHQSLRTRCAIIAAANPKYGRFDRYTGIAEQINMSPTLLSRFDLIFTLLDIPDEYTDRKVANHIVNNFEVGCKINRGEDRDIDPGKKNMVEPPVSHEFLKKYISYARTRIKPTISDEASKRLKDFYLSIRSSADDERGPVPVTPRKLQSLLRLSVASAKMRLSDEVNVNDAEEAIKLVDFSLKQVGIDPETGKFDADLIESGHSRSQQEKMMVMRTIISQVTEEMGSRKGAYIEDVLSIAEKDNIPEDEARKIIGYMRQNGNVFSPEGDREYVRLADN